MGPIGSPETSVLNQFTPRNNPEDGRIQFNSSGSLRGRKNKEMNKRVQETEAKGERRKETNKNR
jgi:hypothetical protein